jgi:spore germination protein GerM
VKGSSGLAFALALALVAGCRGHTPRPAEEKETPAAPTEEAPTGSPAPETAGEVPRGHVQVYFPSAEGSGLVAEEREIFTTPASGDRIKQIVSDLLSGPTDDRALAAVPPGTRLRQAYVVAGGTAYLDFSSELTRLGGGSTTELLTVYAIIDSVVANVPEVKKVGLLVEGAPIETLNGHMDLRRPLAGDLSLILKAQT